MIRAGVFIGVDKTGGLQKLTDAAKGARRMHAWALAQGIVDKTHAKLITDAKGKKVHPGRIFNAIKDLIDGPGVDQLILYFAGHGVNNNRSERWLLTEAPENTSAAVNLSGSAVSARYCGIRHVVIISDACRVAPEGIQAQKVEGVDVFPNNAASDRGMPVDQFFACALGRTASEIKDPAIAAGNYSALYTTALLDALNGARSEVLEKSNVARDRARYVRPRKLEDYLESELPLRVKALKLERKVNQNPDAIITSNNSWVSRIDILPPDSGPAGLYSFQGELRYPSGPSAPLAPAPPNLGSTTRQLVKKAVDNPAKLRFDLGKTKFSHVAEARQLVETAEMVAEPFGPDHFETECGIKVRNNRLVDFFLNDGGAELLGGAGALLRINGLNRPASVFLRFQGDTGTVIPAIPGFIAALTFEGNELVDVAYEPSANSKRAKERRARAAEMHALRAIAASSSLHGRFRLDQEDAGQVARKMQRAKGIDPSFAVYAAYAYHDLQATDRIREMSGFLREDFGATFFDLALLGQTLDNKNYQIVPFIPLLSQGWSLLGALRAKLHPALEGIQSSLCDSLWSLLRGDGLEKLRRAMQTREV